jgi:hypothetical protein
MMPGLPLLLLCALLVAPVASAQGNSGDQGDDDQGSDHQSHGDQGGPGHDGSGHRDDDEEYGGSGDSNESVALNVEQTKDANDLKWVFHGNFHHAHEFAIYRAADGGSEKLLTKVDRHAKEFNDTDLSGLVYTYTVQVLHTDGSDGARSNSETTAQCQWLTISPTGNPPVLLHPECAIHVPTLLDLGPLLGGPTQGLPDLPDNPLVDKVLELLGSPHESG